MCVLSHRIAWMLTTVFGVDLLVISSRPLAFSHPVRWQSPEEAERRSNRGVCILWALVLFPLSPLSSLHRPTALRVCAERCAQPRQAVVPTGLLCTALCAPFPVGREGQSALHDEADDAVDTEGDDGDGSGGGRTAKEDSVEEDIA